MVMVRPHLRNGQVRQIPPVSALAEPSPSSGDEGDCGQQLIGSSRTGCHARTIVGQSEGVGDFLSGCEIKGALLTLLREW